MNFRLSGGLGMEITNLRRRNIERSAVVI